MSQVDGNDPRIVKLNDLSKDERALLFELDLLRKISESESNSFLDCYIKAKEGDMAALKEFAEFCKLKNVSPFPKVSENLDLLGHFAKHNNAKCLEYMLDNFKDLISLPSLLPAFHEIFHKGGAECAKLLLDFNFVLAINPVKVGSQNFAPLTAAIKYADLDLVALLIERMASIDPPLEPQASFYMTPQSIGALPSHLLPPICAAVTKGTDIKILTLLLESGATNFPFQPYSFSAFEYAASLGNAKALSEFLRHIDKETLKISDQHNAPLKAAIKSGDLDSVKVIVEAVGDISYVPGLDNYHPIFDCFSFFGSLEIIRYFLDIESVDINCVDPHGRNLLQYSVSQKMHEVTEFLLQRGLKPVNLKNEFPLLTKAASVGDVGHVKILLRAEFEEDILNPDATQTSYPVIPQHIDIKHHNRFHRHDMSLSIRASTVRETVTPIFAALTNGHKECAEFLLSAGAVCKKEPSNLGQSNSIITSVQQGFFDIARHLQLRDSVLSLYPYNYPYVMCDNLYKFIRTDCTRLDIYGKPQSRFMNEDITELCKAIQESKNLITINIDTKFSYKKDNVALLRAIKDAIKSNENIVQCDVKSYEDLSAKVRDQAVRQINKFLEKNRAKLCEELDVKRLGGEWATEENLETIYKFASSLKMHNAILSKELMNDILMKIAKFSDFQTLDAAFQEVYIAEYIANRDSSDPNMGSKKHFYDFIESHTDLYDLALNSLVEKGEFGMALELLNDFTLYYSSVNLLTEVFEASPDDIKKDEYIDLLSELLENVEDLATNPKYKIIFAKLNNEVAVEIVVLHLNGYYSICDEVKEAIDQRKTCLLQFKDGKNLCKLLDKAVSRIEHNSQSAQSAQSEGKMLAMSTDEADEGTAEAHVSSGQEAKSLGMDSSDLLGVSCSKM